MGRKGNWIQGAIAHPGSLTGWAQAHRLMNKNGTINLARAKRYAERNHLAHREKQINLAHNLRRLSK